MAIAALPVVHVPPVGALVNAVEYPAHALATPAIAVGIGFTVRTAVDAHPIPEVYEIVVVPATFPVTTPELLMAATAAFVLLQVPPLTVFARVSEAPAHTLLPPVMGAGNAFTVTGAVATQPAGGV